MKNKSPQKGIFMVLVQNNQIDLYHQPKLERTLDTKKPCHPPILNKVICANTGILTMQSIKQTTGQVDMNIKVECSSH